MTKKKKDNRVVVEVGNNGTNNSLFTYSVASSYYEKMLIVPEIKDFLESFGIPDLSSFDNVVLVSGFMINLIYILTEEQSRKLLLWVSVILRSALVAHGVKNKVPSLVFSDMEQKRGFYRFFAKLGVSLVKKYPYKAEEEVKIVFTEQSLKILKELGVYYEN